jgi:threonine/homoserine/homoserine lactone efflux protein
MSVLFLFEGMLVGFVLALPVGPIGILCIRETLLEGRTRGMVIGFGGATADLIYSGIAAFSITEISNVINRHRFWIRISCGIILIFLGFFTMKRKPKVKTLQIKSRVLLKTYLLTILLTLTNPLTIFAFIAVFAFLGIGLNHNFFILIFLVIGVTMGSCLWFLVLNTCTMYYGEKFKLTGADKLNRITGMLILISGIVSIVSILL